jgi:signal peptidase I
MMPKNPLHAPLKSLWDFFAEPLLVVGLVFVSTTAIAQPFYVPSGSMQPTIAIGDAMIGNKFAYGWSRWSVPFGLGPESDTRLMGRLPARGDVVIFRKPGDLGTTLVKRVVGLPGDRIQMRDGRLYINNAAVKLEAAGMGEAESESGALEPARRFIETLPGGVRHPILKLRQYSALDNTPVFQVPAGHFFMMGDNRDNSADSRVPEELGGPGFVPVENLMAKAEITIGSYDFLNAHGPATWPGLVRLSRFFKTI